MCLSGTIWLPITQFITRRALFDTNGVTFRQSRRDKSPKFIKYEEIETIVKSASGTIYIHGPDKVLFSFDQYDFFPPGAVASEIAERAGKPYKTR